MNIPKTNLSKHEQEICLRIYENSTVPTEYKFVSFETGGHLMKGNGEILIDGRNINDYSEEEYHKTRALMKSRCI